MTDVDMVAGDAALSCRMITAALKRADLPEGAALYSRMIRFISARAYWLLLVNSSRDGLHYTLSPQSPDHRRAEIYRCACKTMGHDHECDTLMDQGADHDVMVGVTLKTPVPEALLSATRRSDTLSHRAGPTPPEERRRIEDFDDWMRAGLAEAAVDFEEEATVALIRSDSYGLP